MYRTIERHSEGISSRDVSLVPRARLIPRAEKERKKERTQQIEGVLLNESSSILSSLSSSSSLSAIIIIYHHHHHSYHHHHHRQHYHHHLFPFSLSFMSFHGSRTPLYFIRPSMLRKYLKNESIGRWLFERLAWFLTVHSSHDSRWLASTTKSSCCFSRVVWSFDSYVDQLRSPWKGPCPFELLTWPDQNKPAIHVIRWLIIESSSASASRLD